MGHIRAYHDKVQSVERLFEVSYHPRAQRVDHKVDLIFRMAVDRVLELCVYVVHDNEQVFIIYRTNFLLDFRHMLMVLSDANIRNNSIE